MPFEFVEVGGVGGRTINHIRVHKVGSVCIPKFCSSLTLWGKKHDDALRAGKQMASRLTL